jgi:multicomponent K+:H+ antiporter subunit E
MKPRRWFPHPLLSALLALAWLLLQQSLAPAQLITAALLGGLLPRLLHGFMGEASEVRNWPAVLRFTAVVLWDIVVSNLVVARIVLSPQLRPQPAWLVVPLELTQPRAITLLASVITNTPGTLSCIVDERRREIIVHALDCTDAPALVAQIKQRYERPLMEIFG